MGSLDLGGGVTSHAKQLAGGLKARLLLAAVAYPIACLACFYLLVLRTRLAVGHWPCYGHPDPKDLGFDIHHLVVGVELVTVPVFGLAASSLALFTRLRSRDVPWWLVVAPILMAVTAVVWINIDPGGFIDWYLD